MTIAILFIFCSTLKGIYFSAQENTSPFFTIFRMIQNFVYFIYEHTQFISWIWKHAPIINFQTPTAIGNLSFILIAIIGGIGRIIWDSASHLSMRINNTILKVEEFGWEQELMKKDGQHRDFNSDVLQINIELHQEEQWYKRPLGIFLIGTATIIIGQLLNLKFGFIKL